MRLFLCCFLFRSAIPNHIYSQCHNHQKYSSACNGIHYISKACSHIKSGKHGGLQKKDRHQCRGHT